MERDRVPPIIALRAAFIKDADHDIQIRSADAKRRDLSRGIVYIDHPVIVVVVFRRVVVLPSFFGGNLGNAVPFRVGHVRDQFLLLTHQQ